MLKEIGTGLLDFPTIRSKVEDFCLVRYKIPAVQGIAGVKLECTAANEAANAPAQTTGASAPAKAKIKAVAVNNSKAVKRELRQFHPKGKKREKLVTLIAEARTLRLDKQPHAFCFLLRSMFEIGAKAYCADHAASGGPQASKSDGTDRQLVEILRDVTAHLTKNKKDKAMCKLLHGAMAELGKSEGFLSVTSMNQLIHNPRFTVDESHICVLFFNIFPLLESMNS
jgi:hypothetical protein